MNFAGRPRRRLGGKEPIYDDEKFCTLILKYGGRFIHQPMPIYVEKDELVIDYVEHEKITNDMLEKIFEQCFLHGITLFYYISSDGCWELCNNAEKMAGVVKTNFNLGSRNVVIYCDHLPIESSAWSRRMANYATVLDAPYYNEEPAKKVKNNGKAKLVDLDSDLIGLNEDQGKNKVKGSSSKKIRRTVTYENPLPKMRVLKDDVFKKPVDALFGELQLIDDYQDIMNEADEYCKKFPNEHGGDKVQEGTIEDEEMEDVNPAQYEEQREYVEGSGEESDASDSSFDDGGGLLDYDEEMHYQLEDDEEHEVVFDPELILNPKFSLRQVFVTKEHFRRAVHSMAINTGRNLKITCNDRRRCYARCRADNCEWRINCLKMENIDAWQIREYQPTHACVRTKAVKNVSAKFLAEKYEWDFRSDPKRRLSGWIMDCCRDLNVDITRDQGYRAREIALKKIEGDYAEQYNKLWDYGHELRRQNPGSTIILKQTDESSSTGARMFKSFYVGLKPLMDGFKTACRPFIGVDGTWLKGPHNGVLLTAVGVDPNNSLYPIAYAIVMSETKESWVWFLELLRGDLDIANPKYYTFMSDKQKGLIEAFKIVMPGAENRFCVKHLVDNMQKGGGFKDPKIELALWGCAKATTIDQFEWRFKNLCALDEGIKGWFIDKPFSQWSRAHMDEFSKCDAILNNICETLNGNLMSAREQPILTCLEWVRQHITRRFTKLRDWSLRKWANMKVCPRIQAIVDKRVGETNNCVTMKCSATHFEISCSERERYTVDLSEKECTCRVWQLSGIPCVHAICAISRLGEDPLDYVHQSYTIAAYNKAYAPFIMPMNGPSMWMKTGRIAPLPPNMGRTKGRPTMARRRSGDSPRKGKGKKGKALKVPRNIRMVKQGAKQKCSKCKQKGHNKKSCNNRENQYADDMGDEELVNEAANEILNQYYNIQNTNMAQFQANEVHAGVVLPENPNVEPQVQPDTFIPPNVEIPQSTQPSQETVEPDIDMMEDQPMDTAVVGEKRKADQVLSQMKTTSRVASNAFVEVAIASKAKTKVTAPFKPPKVIGSFMNIAGGPSGVNIRGYKEVTYNPRDPVDGDHPFPVISKGNKKFVTISNLPVVVNSLKGKGKNKK